MFARSPEEVAEVERLSRALTETTSAATLPIPEPFPQPSLTVRALPDDNRAKSMSAPAATPTPATPLPQVRLIKGQIRRIDCLDGKLRVVVLSGGKSVTLLILDPAGVTVKSRWGAKIEFYCGLQADTPVVITYVPEPNAQFGTAGRIVAIEYV